MEARFHRTLAELAPAAWDALRPEPQPFLSHAFLHGLESCGCIRPEWGWQPHHLGLYEDGQLVAAAPLYLKTNSHGEFVFDWSWAQAYQQTGGDYYPKLLNAIPYSPVPGPRLLTGRDPDTMARKRQLLQAMQEEAARLRLSSLHANFLSEDELPAFGNEWLVRRDVQFHWSNRGYHDFDAFLAALSPKKRKNIRQERRRVADSGLQLTMRPGSAFSAAQWRRLHGLYRHTFDEKGNHAALSESFFLYLGRTLGEQILVAVACQADEIMAMALFLRSVDGLYGRYWGAALSPEQDPRFHALHFELCYYQGIEYAIQAGLARFEPGAQGQRHKLARGFLPSLTYSRHRLRHPGFHRAVAADRKSVV